MTGQTFIRKVPDLAPILLADIFIDFDWDALPIKSVAAVSLGT